VVRGPQENHRNLNETPWHVEVCATVPTRSICGDHKEAETEIPTVNKHSGHFFLLYVSKKLRIRCTYGRPTIFGFLIHCMVFLVRVGVCYRSECRWNNN
jgi:hypothetical protein